MLADWRAASPFARVPEWICSIAAEILLTGRGLFGRALRQGLRWLSATVAIQNHAYEAGASRIRGHGPGSLGSTHGGDCRVRLSENHGPQSR